MQRIAMRDRDLVVLAYATGATALAAVGTVHLQQYVTIMHFVPWIGPLFVANVAACATTIIGLAFRPTRQLAALGGVAISAFTLAGLVVSYGNGLLGWREAGFRTVIAIDVGTTVVAAIALTFALAVAAARPRCLGSAAEHREDTGAVTRGRPGRERTGSARPWVP